MAVSFGHFYDLSTEELNQRLVPMTGWRQKGKRTKLFMDAVNFNNFIRSSKLLENMQVIYNEMS
ncbi:hypothetical protein MKW92_034445 [Papaver armeniacum]|nr:hypothetical protein MKW92_034445 [Papaver armeniacum]